MRRESTGVEFHCQVPLVGYIVDFYCHEIGLVIEIDGSIHDTQFLEDAKKSVRIEEYGVRFLCFSNDEVFDDIEDVLLKIQAVVAKRFR